MERLTRALPSGSCLRGAGMERVSVSQSLLAALFLQRMKKLGMVGQGRGRACLLAAGGALGCMGSGVGGLRFDEWMGRWMEMGESGECITYWRART